MFAAFALVCGATACGPSNGGGAPATYDIVFTLSDLPEGDDLTSLEFNVAYDQGNFTGSGTAVECALFDGSGDTAVFTDDNAGILNVKIEAENDELVEDADIVGCDFVSTVQPTPDDFPITIVASEPTDEEDVTVVVTSTDLRGSSLTGSSDEPSGDEVE